ncbi:MAG: protein-glutamate O-methyltransferase CheR, partial [Desulfobacterales bacterium]|nr:protein-glutamate O-methyltransferase CheR [Desulfobacterales bacterium]
MEKDLTPVLDFLRQTHGLNILPGRYKTLERKITRQMVRCEVDDPHLFVALLQKRDQMLQRFLDDLTVNVSRFFRNPLTFAFLGQHLLPRMIAEKNQSEKPGLRIWSAGCASGEEPYSLAILVHEVLGKSDAHPDVEIFATDMSRGVLDRARAGVYSPDQLKDIPYGLVTKYFHQSDEVFTLDPAIKKMVRFSHYDMMDAKTYVPPESVFGDFDLVSCRNLIIYFQPNRREIIFDKLFRALSPGGYLVLGRAERLPSRL